MYTLILAPFASVNKYDNFFSIYKEKTLPISNVNSTEASLLPTMVNVVIKNGKLTTLSLDKDSAVYSDLTLNGKKAKTTIDIPKCLQFS